MIKHLACQMDGNRRWATNQGLHVFRGTHTGAQAVKPIAQLCMDVGIKYLSLYTFSIENFKRSEEEKNALFSFMAQKLQDDLEELVRKDIRVRFIGDRSLFPAHLAPICQQLEEATRACTGLNLSFLFCYGGQQEIVYAAQQIARAVHEGTLAIADITPALFSRYLWTHELPEPEIVIRPGAQERLSNFLLFQSAYSEYFFLDHLWPDMTPDIIKEVLREFKQRKRNFGS